MSSNMSDRLLQTLNMVEGGDQAMRSISRDMMRVDKDTGELIDDDEGQGYVPMMTPPDIIPVDKETKVKDFDDSDIKVDYQRVRATTYAMQEACILMMTQAAKLAASTEAPAIFRTFKELGELCRGLNKDLMDNQRMFKEVTKGIEPNPSDGQIVVSSDGEGNTSVTINKGAPRSSRDLLKMVEAVRDHKNKEGTVEGVVTQPEPEIEDAVITTDNEDIDMEAKDGNA